MLKVGYLDDEYDILQSAKRSMKKFNIELIPLEIIDDISDINILVDFIVDNKLECLMVDYNLLKLKSKEYGTKVISRLTTILPDFTCFLITNFIGQGMEEKLVQNMFIESKSIFENDDDSDNFKNFVNKIKNSIECFEKRLELNKTEYSILLNKKKQKIITIDEEEKLVLLYRLLKGYKYVDEIPSILLNNKAQDLLDNMIETLEDFKKSINFKEG